MPKAHWSWRRLFFRRRDTNCSTKWRQNIWSEIIFLCRQQQMFTCYTKLVKHSLSHIVCVWFNTRKDAWTWLNITLLERNTCWNLKSISGPCLLSGFPHILLRCVVRRHQFWILVHVKHFYALPIILCFMMMFVIPNVFICNLSLVILDHLMNCVILPPSLRIFFCWLSEKQQCVLTYTVEPL